ncbi:MAG: serine--tRNA ligase, partial [Acidobacteria bacterium]|nr:serine--tRNA ligase [Acidobacteriota bacterium]
MLDLAFVRDHLELVERKLRARGLDPAAVLGEFRRINEERRQAITRAEALKAERNRASEEIARSKQQKQDAADLIARTRQLREEIAAAEVAAGELDSSLRNILIGIPNLPQDSVPVGSSAEENLEVRRWGSPPEFDFEPRPHWELGEQLGILDLPRATKLSGARFALYWEAGAKLERALANFMLDLH